jgi:hypothetical protein
MNNGSKLGFQGEGEPIFGTLLLPFLVPTWFPESSLPSFSLNQYFVDSYIA